MGYTDLSKIVTEKILLKEVKGILNPTGIVTIPAALDYNLTDKKTIKDLEIDEFYRQVPELYELFEKQLNNNINLKPFPMKIMLGYSILGGEIFLGVSLKSYDEPVMPFLWTGMGLFYGFVSSLLLLPFKENRLHKYLKSRAAEDFKTHSESVINHPLSSELFEELDKKTKDVEFIQELLEERYRPHNLSELKLNGFSPRKGFIDHDGVNVNSDFKVEGKASINLENDAAEIVLDSEGRLNVTGNDNGLSYSLNIQDEPKIVLDVQSNDGKKILTDNLRDLKKIDDLSHFTIKEMDRNISNELEGVFQLESGIPYSDEEINQTSKVISELREYFDVTFV